MIKLLKYLKGYSPEAITAPLSKIIEAIIELLVPFLVEAMIDDGINADGKTNSTLFLLLGIDAGGGTNVSYIIWLGIIMVGMAAIGLGFSLTAQYLASKSGVGFGCNVRAALFGHIQKTEISRLDEIGTSSLVNRLSGDVAAAQYGLAMFMRLVLRAPFLAVGAVLMCVLVAPQLWYVYLIAAVVSMGALILIMQLSVPRYTAVQSGLDKVSSITGETIKGERVIRAFSNEGKSVAKFSRAVESQTKASTRASIISCLLSPVVTLTINTAIIVILFMGSGQLVGGGMTTGKIIALINYMTQMLLAFIVLALFTTVISKALTGAKRINEVFALPIVSDGNGAVAVDGEIIRMENATFSFGSESNAIEGVTFSLLRGETLGIIGTTGSGKSTLASLAARLCVPSEGKVFLMGNESTAYTEEQICEIVTLAPQRALLFGGTVRSNLEWSGCRDDDEMIGALKACSAFGFLKSKQGLDTVVNQKGTNFSGGEKQRLSLARALLKNSPLLILDDAASALDYVTEAKIKRNIAARSRDKAVIIISGRVGAIMNADNIIVLDGGAVVGQGNHKQLLESCELYRKLSAQT